ncbi:MAG: carboxylating nicotinate-nucleotide diphosphorylase [Candidatus Omnitrophota bacterium]
MYLNNSKIKDIVLEALREDKASFDITTKALIGRKRKANAQIIAREDCILSGLAVAKAVFKAIHPHLKFVSRFKDGAAIGKGSIVAKISGNARAILSGERVALNFLSHMSGIATLTAKFLNKVRGTKVKIMDTRKTIPLMRQLEKYAFSCGGGIKNRMSLADSVIIKDNHKKILRGHNLKDIIKKAKLKTSSNTKIEIEIENIKEFSQIIHFAPDIIMLDNMSLAQLKTCLILKRRFSPKTKLEASGGVSLQNVHAIAKTGVDFISVGCLTHSPKAIDFSLDIA